ncbi:hypothetical protein [Escherichia coli]
MSNPWEMLLLIKDGLPVMNGVVMTEDNSSLVDNPLGVSEFLTL